MQVQSPFKSRTSSVSVLLLFVLATLLIQVVILLLVFSGSVQLKALTAKSAPTLVQLIDGRVLQVTAADVNYRSPLVIQRHVQQWAMLTYNWSGYLPPADQKQAKKPLPDPGVEMGDSKLPTTAVLASYLITDEHDFRRQFLTGLIKLVPDGLFEGVQQTALKISDIVSSQQTADGQWNVKLYAFLQVLDNGHSVGLPIKVKKQITLQAVPPPNYPIQEGLSPIQQAVYRLGEAGLQIIGIEDMA